MRNNHSVTERRSWLLSRLREVDRVTLEEFKERFNVSEVSLRKDFEYLEKQELLIRVKGGVINFHQTLDDKESLSFEMKVSKNIREKEAIGQLASSLISEGDTIILDSGSTTLQIAKQLLHFKNLQVVTNGLMIANELSKNPNIKVILLGGVLQTISNSTLGMIAENSLKYFYCDKLFLGVDSISLDKGISTSNIEEASLNQVMMTASKQVIAVFDSDKFKRSNFALISDISRLDTIITDSKIDPETKTNIQKLGIKMLIAEVE